jgi:hypothetical protein
MWSISECPVIPTEEATHAGRIGIPIGLRSKLTII